MKKWLILSIVWIFCYYYTYSQSVLKLDDFGWSHLKTGAERARVLYEIQNEAVLTKTPVDYSGISEIDIEITSDFKSIPLLGCEDFKHIVFNVTNNAKDVKLFSLVGGLENIEVEKKLLDGKYFGKINSFKGKEILLVIKDNNPWVDNRTGYDYGHYRKDVLLIRNAKSLNSVINTYNNCFSDPICSYCVVSPNVKYVRNFTINRVEGSTYKTSCIEVKAQSHVVISNIKINTPDSDLYGDYAILIRDCADITLKDIEINGTYSQSNKYGYGIHIDNVWNILFENVKGVARWGVMGTKNVNNITLLNCSLNRFDIHCYGKDVYLKNCIFDGGKKGWYCGGTSIFGTIQYDSCTFINCNPIRYTESYKTSVGAEVIFNDCVFYASSSKNSIFYTGSLQEEKNTRNEVSKKCLPNITINNMKIIVPSGLNKICLYDIGRQSNQGTDVLYKDKVGYINKIQIGGLTIVQDNPNDELAFEIFSEPILSENKIKLQIIDSKLKNTSIINTVMTTNNKSSILIKNTIFDDIQEEKDFVKIRIKDCSREK